VTRFDASCENFQRCAMCAWLKNLAAKE
jgi:hypothetical protein